MDATNTKQWPQYLAAITATIALATTGAHIGWTSPTLPLLKSSNSPLPITSNEASWIASFYLLGAVPGNIIAAFLVNHLGRKISLLLAGAPLLLGWVLILVAWNPYVLYASRLISGIGQGIIYVVCPMYIGEIADKNIRGALGSFIRLMVTFGELYAHAVGPFVSYEWLAYACVALSLVFYASFSWMPESPYYLIMKNDQEAAEKSLLALRRYQDKEDLETEMEQIQKSVIKELSNTVHIWDLFDSPGTRKAVLISLGLQLVLQLSGMAAIESYTQEMFEESDSGLSPGLAVIILSVLQLMAGLGAIVLVDRLGRRPLLLSSALLAGVSLTIATIFYLLKLYYKINMDGLGWILDFSIMFYQVIVALGLSPVSYMMLGELFPTNVKGVAVCLANTLASLLAFIVSKLYQVITDACGIYTTFGCFAMILYVGIGFLLFAVPETKGKSLLEIQEELNCKRNHKRKETTIQPDIVVSTIC
ncbi:facilitated trehalose transporter Tret1 [Cephus cinctus]|uniref:Facilitated trehalose transporter Tret1 n=1 Tax=Cephus cinctus TaxID=211228 RepID=A0AAJ7BN65_CEPCN|nr:facilitated trehalose transporter Tret1 [Cephus cinctus]